MSIYLKMDADGCVLTARQHRGPVPDGFEPAPPGVSDLSQAVRLRKTQEGWITRQPIPLPERSGATVIWASPPPGMKVRIIDAALGDLLAVVSAPESGPLELEFDPGRYLVTAKAPPMWPMETELEIGP